jgi:acetyltransferase-like isoleucine patch superfamily enzyme
MNNLKIIIPSSIKAFVWQSYLRFKHRRYNHIGKRVILAKDFNCHKECVIGNDVIIGRGVILGRGVRIGMGACLEKVEVSDHTDISTGVIITGHGDGTIRIGRESYIGIYNVLDWSDNITIGDYVHIAGPSTGLWTHTSAPMCINGIPLRDKDPNCRPTASINIGNNVYIGGNCTIYPGVTIGHHAIVAPNSAVTRNVEPYTMVGGVPARFIKKIYV